MTQTPSKIRSSFTGSKNNHEQRIDYFGEDIGMNTHHVTWHLKFPFRWDDSNENYHTECKGENFFWIYYQLTVRYGAERLSKYLDHIEELYWDDAIQEGFAPHTMCKYCGEYPSRPDNIVLEDVEGVPRVRDILILENRARDAIANGYVTAKVRSTISIRGDDGADIVETSLSHPSTDPTLSATAPCTTRPT